MVGEHKGKGLAWLTLGGGEGVGRVVGFTWHNEGRESRRRLSADHQRGKGRGSDVVKLFECAFASKKTNKKTRQG